MGELRKWSLIYPRMLQAGIHAPIEEAEEEVLADEERPIRFKDTNDEFKQRLSEAALAVASVIGEVGAHGTITISKEGKVYVDLEYVAKITMEM